MDCIINKPIITEKSFADAQKDVFTFSVKRDASKKQIKKTIEGLFKVHVKSVMTNLVKGKKRMVGKKRLVIYETDWKKARVVLEKGEKIDLFEVGEKK